MQIGVRRQPSFTPPSRTRLPLAFEAVVKSLQPDQVAEVVLDEGETIRAVKRAILQSAIRQARNVEMLVGDRRVYFRLKP